jgi:hypothetical protein
MCSSGVGVWDAWAGWQFARIAIGLRSHSSATLRGYLYLLVLDVDQIPPVVARFVHQARDLPVLLNDLGP